MLHHIQKTALDTLAAAESLRYSQIKPTELDGNTFGYHLKQLISEDYVAKSTDGSYALTSKGRDYIMHRYEDPTRSAHTIFLVVVRNGDNYLVRRRKVQPMLGKIGFVHGEPEPGMSVVESAQKRLLAKTGISATLAVVGSALITQYLADELHSYSHAIILTGKTTDDCHIASDDTGENLWTSSLNDNDILPSCYDIAHADWEMGPKEFSYYL
jgi:hypothetical protein